MVDFLSLVIEPAAAGGQFSRNRKTRIFVTQSLSNFRQKAEKTP
jgi:hypothetical protein